MNEERKDTSKQVLLSVLGVAILIVAVVGISFAAFTYTRAGQRENIVTTGTVSMEYNEDTNGINIENAIPMTEQQAVTNATVVNNSGVNATNDKTSVNDNVFDFTVKAEITGNTKVNYEVVAVKATEDQPTGCVYASGKDITTGVLVASDGQTVDEKAVEYSKCDKVGDNDIRLRLDKKASTDSDYTKVATFEGFKEETTNGEAGRATTTNMMVMDKGTFTTTTEYNYRLWMWVNEDYVVDSVARSYKVKVNVYGKTPSAS